VAHTNSAPAAAAAPTDPPAAAGASAAAAQAVRIANEIKGVARLGDARPRAAARAPLGAPSLTPGAPPFLQPTKRRPQGLGLVLRVSCVTPVLGPCLGFVGVGLASAVAGQARASSAQRLARPLPPPLPPAAAASSAAQPTTTLSHR